MTKKAAEFAATSTSSPAATPPPSIEVFLGLVASDGHLGKAAERAGITLEGIAALARTDATFKQRFADARSMRRYLLRDALWEEGVLGVESRDSVNGTVSRKRDRTILVALARKEQELDHDRPAVAIQNNVTAPSASEVHQRRALGKQVLDDLYLEAAKRDAARRALPKPVTITVDAEIVDSANQEL